MTWLVYMILANDQSIYTGVTTDISRRWQQHKTGNGGAKFFRGRKPAQLLYLETGHDRSSALRKELQLKKLTNSQKWHHVLNSQQDNKVASFNHGLPIWSQKEKETGIIT